MTHQKLTFLGVINIVIRDILDIPGKRTHGAHQHHDDREVCEGTSHFILKWQSVYYEPVCQYESEKHMSDTRNLYQIV
jgi:hypothetical protein